MIFVPGVLVALGVMGLLFRKSVVGILISTQVLTIAMAVFFAMLGGGADLDREAHAQVMALMVILSGVCVLVVGAAISVRLFYSRGQAKLNEVQTLKH